MVRGDTVLRANPTVVLREEFDDSAVLFDPDTGEGYGLNPVGIFVWKLLDGEHTVDQIKNKVSEGFRNIEEHAGEQIEGFLEDLLENGLVGSEI